MGIIKEFEVLSSEVLLHPCGRKREVYSVKCPEGHVSQVNAKTFNDLTGCKECIKKYYKTKEYNIVDGIKQRCNNPKTKRYPHYGGKGVTICDSWDELGYRGVRNFLLDMGYCPEGHSIDRIDVNGNYEPSNCRWAKPSLQGYNQTKRITNTSGRTGVSWDSSKDMWEARITVENKPVFLGRRSSFESACALREQAELKYFGWSKQIYE